MHGVCLNWISQLEKIVYWKTMYLAEMQKYNFKTLTARELRRIFLWRDERAVVRCRSKVRKRQSGTVCWSARRHPTPPWSTPATPRRLWQLWKGNIFIVRKLSTYCGKIQNCLLVENCFFWLKIKKYCIYLKIIRVISNLKNIIKGILEQL